MLLTWGGLGCDEREPPPTPPPEIQRPSPRPSGAREETRLEESVEALRRTNARAYLPPSAAESELYRNWVGHLATSAMEGHLPTEKAPEGFVGRWLDRGRIWLLAEETERNRGAGAVALRIAVGAEIIVEIPHSFFDEGTLPIGLTVFEELDARALLVNTVHRGGTGPEPERLERARSGTSESDVAHQISSFFHQAHLELGRAWPRAQVVQLHGFRDEKVPTAKIIVSAAGTGAATAPLARALNDAFGVGTARLYPEEVQQLGGTENVQARANAAESRPFLHIEIAASLRNQMQRQKSLRDRFARALALGLAVP